MNAIEKIKLEKKVRLLAFEEAEEKLLPFADMKENVLRACAQRMQTAENRRENRKARLRNTRRVALATACLLVGVCVFSVLAPVPVSTANGFLRKAQIWVGGLLQLNVSYGPPEMYGERSGEYGAMPTGYQEKSNWASLQEIRDTYGVNLLEPATEAGTWTLDTAKAVGEGEERFIEFFYSFTRQDIVLTFTYGSVADEMGSAIFVEDVLPYTTPAGDFYTWSTEEKQYAQIILDGRLVSVISDMPKDAFLKTLDGLRAVN